MPHSETPGSKRACRSPGLIAADRVLHRLVMPRHPSCARIRLAEDRNPRHSRYVATLLDTQTVQLSKIGPPPGGREIPSGRALPRVLCRELVGVPGIEPGTSSLSGTRSNQLSYTPGLATRGQRLAASDSTGGGSRGRTGGIQLAKLALYQLSYAPGAGRLSRRVFRRFSVGPRLAARGGCGRILSLLASVRVAARLRAAAPRRAFHHRRRISAGLLLRKEVIQPLVPQRLPCYDFIPITTHTLGGSPPCGLVRRLRVQTAFMM